MLLGDKDMRGKGYAVDTIMTIMKYAFEELGLNRLDGSIIEYNEPSYGVYVKMWLEGRRVQREWYFRNNKFWDKRLLELPEKIISSCWIKQLLG